jgi:hypothetical protein
MSETKDGKVATGQQALGAATGLLGDGKIKDIATTVKPAGTSAELVKVEPKKGGDPVQATTVKPVGTPAESVKKPDPVVVDTPFGKKVYGETGGKEGKLESFEDVQLFAKAFDLNLENVEDLRAVIKGIGSVPALVKQVGAQQSAINAHEANLRALPQEVKTIMDAAMNKKDYGQVISMMATKSGLDYKQSFNSYNEKDMINRYSDKKYSEEEFSEMEAAQYKAVKSLAQVRYETDKSTFDARVAEEQRFTDARNQSFSLSVESSIARLKENNPDMGEPQINRVRQIMTSDLHNTLFNTDETYKPDAAERIAMQEFGKEAILAQQHTIGDLVNKFRAEGATQATEQTLLRSDNNVPVSPGAAPVANRIADEVKRQTDFIGAR